MGLFPKLAFGNKPFIQANKKSVIKITDKDLKRQIRFILPRQVLALSLLSVAYTYPHTIIF